MANIRGHRDVEIWRVFGKRQHSGSSGSCRVLRMAKILVVGSANYDLVFQCKTLPRPGETLLGGEFATFPGGKGANQAVACGRLEAEVYFCGCTGRDSFAVELRTSLSSAGVDLAWLAESDARTGTAAVIVDEAGANQIVVAPGANARLTPAVVEAAIAAVEPELVLAQLEIPLDAVAAASQASRFILNPAPAAKIPDAILSRCFAITPNQSEAEALTGVHPDDEESCAKAAAVLLAQGVENVVITLGAQGCFWSDGRSQTLVPALAVIPVDTTAAGDAFNGALATFLASGHPWIESLTLANLVAGMSTMTHGAQPSMPTIKQVRERQGMA